MYMYARISLIIKDFLVSFCPFKKETQGLHDKSCLAWAWHDWAVRACLGWPCLGWPCLDWAGLAWAGLAWAGLAWAGKMSSHNEPPNKLLELP